jgi:predicted glutamine amidotransferase
MCRLFAMTAGEERIAVTHWLLDAPDSLIAQSHFQPDGTGLGFFDEAGNPVVDRQPLAAFRDDEFIKEARTERSSTFLAHIRFASMPSFAITDTHPFQSEGRLFAHNGVAYGMEDLEREIGTDYMGPVEGSTDSERVFALITKRIDETGDVGEGIASATSWMADNVPLYSLNLTLATADELWALRYPDTHELFVLERGPRKSGPDEFHGTSSHGLRVHSDDLGDTPAVVVASERMDDEGDWRALEPGELLHVTPDVETHSRIILDRPPRHLLGVDDLDPRSAESQRHPKAV